MRVEHNQVRGGGPDRLLQFAELRELADPTVPLMRHRLADPLADMHLRVTEQNRDIETVLPIHPPNLPSPAALAYSAGRPQIAVASDWPDRTRSEEHTSELQSLM